MFPTPARHVTVPPMRYLNYLILALTPLVWATAVQAQSVAIMPVESPDRQADGQRLFQLLRDALPANGLQDKGEVSLSVPEARISFSCFEEKPACMAQVGRILEADELIWAKLESNGPDTVVTLSWLVVSTGALKHPRATVTVPGGVKLAPYLDRAAPAFIAGKPLPPVAAKSRITFVSEPSGAVVWLDDAKMGETPTTIELVSGTYDLKVKLDGHATQSKTLKVDGKKTLRFDMMRAAAMGGAVTGTTEPTGSGSSWKLWTGVGALVGAVALTSLSVVKMGEANDLVKEQEAACAAQLPDCTDRRLQSDKEDEFSSVFTTHVVSGVGAGVLAGVGAWLLIDYALEDDAGVSVTPTLGGAAIIGRF